jgi:hypothetical protein
MGGAQSVGTHDQPEHIPQTPVHGAQKLESDLPTDSGCSQAHAGRGSEKPVPERAANTVRDTQCDGGERVRNASITTDGAVCSVHEVSVPPASLEASPRSGSVAAETQKTQNSADAADCAPADSTRKEVEVLQSLDVRATALSCPHSPRCGHSEAACRSREAHPLGAMQAPVHMDMSSAYISRPPQSHTELSVSAQGRRSLHTLACIPHRLPEDRTAHLQGVTGEDLLRKLAGKSNRTAHAQPRPLEATVAGRGVSNGSLRAHDRYKHSGRPSGRMKRMRSAAGDGVMLAPLLCCGCIFCAVEPSWTRCGCCCCECCFVDNLTCEDTFFFCASHCSGCS